MAPTKTCTHIKVTGVRCGSPALYGERFCYFHQNAHRGVRKPPQSRLHPIAILEDEASIQSSLMEVINALMRNTIDLKRAELILRALHIAVKNSRRAKFGNSHDMVREVPEYADPEVRSDMGPSTVHVGTGAIARPASEASAAASMLGQSVASNDWPEPGEPGAEDELPAVSAMRPRPVVEEDPELWERMERGGQILKRQEAESKAQASAVPPHDFKKLDSTDRQAAPAATQSVPEGRPKVAQRFSAGNAANQTMRAVGTPDPRVESPTAPPRKPAQTAPAPKERKNAAHRASGG